MSGDFLQALVPSFATILASEIGDKTFFIAAIMAMRNPRLKVFGGSIGALGLMTILSSALGWAAPNLIPKVYTHYAAVILFFFFGLNSLRESLKGASGEESELEQVENEVDSDNQGGLDGNNHSKSKNGISSIFRIFFSPIFLKAFTLCFLAEWGDRSQIVTIGLAASKNVYGVTVGGILGHSICTGAAVIGGKKLAAHINEQMVAAVGGVLFLIFGVLALYEGPGS